MSRRLPVDFPSLFRLENPAERVILPKAASLLRIVEKYPPDLVPRPLEDSRPFLCRAVSPRDPPAADLARVFEPATLWIAIDLLYDPPRHLEAPAIDSVVRLHGSIVQRALAYRRQRSSAGSRAV
jgi:hypothetical protein